MINMGLSVEEVNAISGIAMGRSRSGYFKLADLVGIDTFLHVGDNSYTITQGTFNEDYILGDKVVRVHSPFENYLF